jgi:hypothetical protein
MFKVGDKVICINTYNNFYKKNNVYNIISVDYTRWEIKLRESELDWMPMYMFVDMCYFRRQKINKILNKIK